MSDLTIEKVICKKCNQEIDLQHSFCPYCGNRATEPILREPGEIKQMQQIIDRLMKNLEPGSKSLMSLLILVEIKVGLDWVLGIVETEKFNKCLESLVKNAGSENLEDKKF